MTQTFQTYKHPYKSVLVILCNGVSDFRMTLMARTLSEAGYAVSVMSVVPYHVITQYDLIICCRPGVAMCAFIDTALHAGVPVVIDMDDDFLGIPKTNPAYNIIGAGAAPYHQTLKKTLAAATVCTYASSILSERYKLSGMVIPNCFDERNTNWQDSRFRLPWSKPGDITFGWAGSNTHLEDFKLLLPGLLNVLTTPENANAFVFIGGDPDIYNLLTGVPEHKKMFYPGLPYDMYPLMFRYIDVWLAPLVDTYFNRAKSDIKLLEAGARGIPWLASNVKQYADWEAGGWLVGNSVEDWAYSLGNLLYLPAGEFQRKAWEGHEKAQTRTSEATGRLWLQVVEGLIG